MATRNPAIEVPVFGDRLTKAKLEAEVLSNDALAYILAMALLSVSDHVDEKQAPGTKTRLELMARCLQGDTDAVSFGVPSEAMIAAVSAYRSLTERVPERDVGAWN